MLKAALSSKIMKLCLLFIISTIFIYGCSENEEKKTLATKPSVYEWSGDLIKQLADIYPDSFQKTLLDPSTTDANSEVPFNKVELVFLRDAGIISSISEVCDLDWAEKNYLPVMQWQRTLVTEAERNGRKISMVGALHGAYQGQTDNWLQEHDAKCDEAQTILSGNLFADKFKF